MRDEAPEADVMCDMKHVPARFGFIHNSTLLLASVQLWYHTGTPYLWR